MQMLSRATALIIPRRCRARRLAVILGFALPIVPAGAAPVVQPVPGHAALPASPSADALRLNVALARLARNPRDVEALIDAGNAALASGDVDAAIGFFTRADQVMPGNARALAGLAGALLQNNDPVGAIPVFDRAETSGARDPAFIADRGLAWDLVGEPLRAQGYYRQALVKRADPETERRLALSQAIAGDSAGAEATLRPLLQDQDKASWRTRTFIFAILGQVDEAVTVAKSLLPADLAAAITPYLRYMPKLTRAQQAAAANLGMFPRASDIGTDDPRIAQFVAAHADPKLGASDKQLAPLGEPGRKQETESRREPRALTKAERAAALAGRTAPPDPLPLRQVETVSAATARTGAPPVPGVQKSGASFASPTVSAPASGATRAATPGLAPVGSTPRGAGVVGAAQGLARPNDPQFEPFPMPGHIAAGSAMPAAIPAATGSVTAGTSPPRSLVPSASPSDRVNIGTAFGDIGKPELDAHSRAGAIDIARLEAARARAAKPPPPSHPSRIWVQLATGHDKDALATDWHRFVRISGGALKAYEPFVSEWGTRNRLLTGPFESEAAAKSFIQQLAKANFYGSFIWTSPAGQVVDSLDDR
jgi:Flp pilus assembly protein TadD